MLEFLAALALAQTAPLAPVEQQSLSLDAFSTGVLSEKESGFDSDLWNGADAGALAALLDASPAQSTSPAMGEAMRATLLARGRGPADPTGALGAAKLLALVRLGFFEEARQIESFSAGGDASAGAMALADLLAGDVAAACARNARLGGRDEPVFVKLRILCYTASDNLDAAELAFGVLRERSGLSPTDDVIFAALSSGGKLSSPIAAEDPVQRAALALMNAPQSDEFPGDGALAIAAMRDVKAPYARRLEAARAAAAAGLVAGDELRALHAAASLSPAEVAGADAASGAAMAEAASFQAVASLSAPEFVAERAQKIAAIAAAAPTPHHLFLRAALYEADIAKLDPASLSGAPAAAIARLFIARGDADGAARWLTAAAAPKDEERADFASLIAAFAALDGEAAASIANAVGIAITPTPTPAGATDSSFAPIAAAAIDAAARDVKGQSALAAIAASHPRYAASAIAEAITGASLFAAGRGDLARRLLAERLLAASFSTSQAQMQSSASPMPRVKPSTSR